MIFPRVNGKGATEPGPSRYCGNTATAVVRTVACYFPTVHLDVTARGKHATTTTGLAVFYERGVHDQTASTDIALYQEAATVATVPAIGNYAAVKR
ncbi:hypothetical protein GCM10008915_24130 [Bifidobacterium pullorum subsp. gallinarum]